MGIRGMCRQKDKNTKNTKRQNKNAKTQKTKTKREFNIATSGQFCTLAMFFGKIVYNKVFIIIPLGFPLSY